MRRWTHLIYRKLKGILQRNLYACCLNATIVYCTSRPFYLFVCGYSRVYAFLSHLEIADMLPQALKPVSPQRMTLKRINATTSPHIYFIFQFSQFVPKPSFVAFFSGSAATRCLCNLCTIFLYVKPALMCDIHPCEGDFKLCDKNVLLNGRPTFPVMCWTVLYVQRGTYSSRTKP